MKKFIILLLAVLMMVSVVACREGDASNSGNNSSNKVKLLGDIIPKPDMDYDVINGSDESVYLEVKNATERDFRDYVESCESYGFDGYIKSATFPDLYFMEYNDDNYFLEVRFMEDEQEFSVYVRIPSEKQN